MKHSKTKDILTKPRADRNNEGSIRADQHKCKHRGIYIDNGEVEIAETKVQEDRQQ